MCRSSCHVTKGATMAESNKKAIRVLSKADVPTYITRDIENLIDSSTWTVFVLIQDEDQRQDLKRDQYEIFMQPDSLTYELIQNDKRPKDEMVIEITVKDKLLVYVAEKKEVKYDANGQIDTKNTKSSCGFARSVINLPDIFMKNKDFPYVVEKVTDSKGKPISSAMRVIVRTK